MKPIIPSQKVLDLWRKLEKLGQLGRDHNAFMHTIYNYGIDSAIAGVDPNNQMFQLQGKSQCVYLFFKNEQELEKVIKYQIEACKEDE